MIINSSSIVNDASVRQHTGDYQPAQKRGRVISGESRETASTTRPIRDISPAAESPSKAKRTTSEPLTYTVVAKTAGARYSDGPAYYRFKDPSEFPSRAQQALGTYAENQAAAYAAEFKVEQVEVKSTIDTFA